MKKKVKIITDCVCDLSNDFLQSQEVDVVRFYLTLDSGRFMDGYEISVSNVIEHYEDNKTKIVSNVPSPKEYAQIYREQLKTSETVIHYTISSLISDSYKLANEGRDLLGEKASKGYIVNSLTLSSGIAFLILQACDMRKRGYDAEAIVKASQTLISKVNVSFVAKNADYLAINGRVSSLIAKFVRSFRLRPVFYMDNGKLTVLRFEHGNREKYIKKYIRRQFKQKDKIDTERVFITHAACAKDEVDRIVAEVRSIIDFKNIHICTTSASVACNCGAEAVGVIYKYKDSCR